MVTKTSLQHHPPANEEHIGCGYNNSARPFNANQNGGSVKSIVNKQYNTPVGMYSEESIAETLTAQAEVLANGVLGMFAKARVLIGTVSTLSDIYSNTLFAYIH